jgi:hypothetical protein
VSPGESFGPYDSPHAEASRSSSAASPPAGLADCRTSQLRAELRFESVSGATVRSQLELKNTGSGDCAVTGWATFRLENGSGGSLAANTVEKDHPAGPAEVVLAPGESAYAGAEWDAGDGCAAAGAVSVTPPGQPSPIVAHLTGYGSAAEMADRLRVCNGAVTAGTLQKTGSGSQF